MAFLGRWSLFGRITLSGALACTCVLDASGSGGDREHLVKAGFILNFAKYCDWDSLPSKGGHLLVGVYQTDAYGDCLNALNGNSVAGSVISVERIETEDELLRCQIVVVGSIEAGQIRHLVKVCRNSGTLLIGESDGFASFGGTIGFVLEDQNVRFEVNLTTAKCDNVRLSSKLLRLARQVY